MFNYFVFDGHDSRDYGVYISGGGTFNSPAREYDNISVPGRDGDLLGINTRLQNVTLTYPAGVVSDFSNNIAGLRNMLLSTVGYAVLRDSYHPDEYRYAVYKGGLTQDPLSDLSAGEFNIVFECKPQRYLDAGGEAQDVDAWGDTDTETGDIVTFTGEPDTGIKDLSVAITPVQAGTGTPAPDNVRAISGWASVNVNVNGKNLLPVISAGSYTINNVTLVVNNDGTMTVTTNGAASATTYFNISENFRLPAGLSLTLTGAIDAGARLQLTDYPIVNNKGFDSNSGMTFTSESIAYAARIVISSGKTLTGATFKPMIRLASDTDSTYEPYTGTTTPVSLGRTVYGGTLDVTTGALKARPYYASYAGEALVGPWISSMDPYAAGTTPTTGAQVVDMGGAETSYTLTPAQVAALVGTNNVWADAGPVTVEYGADPSKMYNPTLMPARPLIRVYGYGTLTVGTKTVTITNYNKTYIDIDCAMMDCYNGSTNLNSYVTFSDNDFPTLGAGVTPISYSGNITKVLITTNWWRV